MLTTIRELRAVIANILQEMAAAPFVPGDMVTHHDPWSNFRHRGVVLNTEIDKLGNAQIELVILTSSPKSNYGPFREAEPDELAAMSFVPQKKTFVCRTKRPAREVVRLRLPSVPRSIIEKLKKIV